MILTSSRPASSAVSSVRTIIDELLYETTKFSVSQAITASQTRATLPPLSQLPLMKEEIRHSMIAIVSAVTCLDTYINSVFEDSTLSTGLREGAKGINLVQKWYNAPSILGLTGRFNYDASPMTEFKKIVNFRNYHVIHRKNIYSKPTSGYPVPEYQYFNITTAQTALTTTKNMIATLCGFMGTSVPSWL